MLLNFWSKKLTYFLFFLILLFSFKFVFSQSSSNEIVELQSKIYQKNVEIEQLEKELNLYKKQLLEIQKQSNSLTNALKELDLDIKKTNTDIQITQKKIDLTLEKIKELSIQINNKMDEISKNKLALANSLKIIDDFDKKSQIEFLLSQSALSDFFSQQEQNYQFQKEIKNKISTLKEIKSGLETDKNEKIAYQEELNDLKRQLLDQKKVIIQAKEEKQKLLKETKKQESNYKNIIAQKEAFKQQFEQELERYEATLKFILDKSKLPEGRVLSWPLDDILITQKFGVTKDSKKLYASGFHYGVDFRASIGTPVKAVADGEVEGIGDTDLTCPNASFGKWVFIRHNNGLATTYAHLSLISVYSGQKVKRGEIIGYSGNTGHSTAPHLHLAVYASDGVKVGNLESKACGGKTYTIPIAAKEAYLDPLIYLPSYTPEMVKQ